jgi:opacity protein-like surface antigen
MKKIIHSAITVAVISNLAFAGGDIAPVPVVMEENNSGFYLGLGLSYQRTYALDSTWFGTADTQDETGGLGFIAGYEYNQYVSVEGRFSTSLFEEDYAEVSTYSIFVKPQYPVTEEFKVYALLGFGNVNVKASDAGGSYFGAPPSIVGNTLMDESGFQWGLGMSYLVTEEINVFIDYVAFASDAEVDRTRLYNYSGAEYTEMSNDAITLGVTYKF